MYVCLFKDNQEPTEQQTPYIVELPDESDVASIDIIKDQQVRLEEKDTKVEILLLLWLKEIIVLYMEQTKKSFCVNVRGVAPAA